MRYTGIPHFIFFSENDKKTHGTKNREERNTSNFDAQRCTVAKCHLNSMLKWLLKVKSESPTGFASEALRYKQRVIIIVDWK